VFEIQFTVECTAAQFLRISRTKMQSYIYAVHEWYCQNITSRTKFSFFFSFLLLNFKHWNLYDKTIYYLNLSQDQPTKTNSFIFFTCQSFRIPFNLSSILQKKRFMTESVTLCLDLVYQNYEIVQHMLIYFLYHMLSTANWKLY